MRIAYFAHLNDGHGSGVVAKIAAQVERWRAEGHVVRVFLATRDPDPTWAAAFGHVSIARYEGPASRLRAMTRLVRAMRRFDPSVVYMRWDLFYPPMLWFPATAPLIAEVNTDDLAENALGSRPRALYNRLTRGLILRRVAALVFVTSELADRPAFQRASVRHAVITNGVDLADYPVLDPPTGGPPRLVFVGTGDVAWHGVDKVGRLAALRPDWQFDIVGVARPAAFDIPNVTWHPSLDRPRLLEVMARADVGIGTLALHRKDLDEGSPLKVREYLAVGLPVLYGYHDPDADDLGPYVLRIDNTETSIEDAIDRIDAFVCGARGVRVPRSSVAHIDAAVKEGQRLALFAGVAGD